MFSPSFMRALSCRASMAGLYQNAGRKSRGKRGGGGTNRGRSVDQAGEAVFVENAVDVDRHVGGLSEDRLGDALDVPCAFLFPALDLFDLFHEVFGVVVGNAVMAEEGSAGHGCRLSVRNRGWEPPRGSAGFGGKAYHGGRRDSIGFSRGRGRGAGRLPRKAAGRQHDRIDRIDRVALQWPEAREAEGRPSRSSRSGVDSVERPG